MPNITVITAKAPTPWSEVSSFLRNQLCDKTRIDYRNDLAAFIRFVRRPALAVTPSDVIDFKESLEVRGLKPATIHKRLAVVRSFYKFLSMTLNVPNPALCVKLPKVSDESTKSVLSLQETVRFLSVIDHNTTLGKRDRAIMALLLVNGLRSIEVARTSIGDIHTVDGFTVLRVHGKGGKIADTKLREDVYRAILTYLETRNTPKYKEPLFLSIGNLAKGRISPKTIQGRVKYYLAAAGINRPHLSCHSLRHTCAILTLSIGGADLVQVQRLLRHADPKVTMRYLSALDSLKDNGVDRNPVSLP